MNTGKQVNAMIGLLFLAVLILGAYFLNESTRQAEATEHITERNAERGARLFVANCRTCHGLTGEGGVGPTLNTEAFLILGEDNEFGVEATPQGEADGVRKFLTDTISCGRTGTFMPPWSQEYGGALTDTQVQQLVTMITNGRWDLVEELGHEADEETGATAEDILVTDPSQLAVTQNNCGQYDPDTAREFRTRDPFAPPGAAPATPTPSADGTPAPPPPAGEGVAVSMGEFFITPAQPSAPADGIAFNVANEGQVAHEFVVIQSDLAPDALPIAGGMVDESQVQVVGRIDQFAGGQTQSGTFDMAAGPYVLICNLPGHYTLGMYAGFTAE